MKKLFFILFLDVFMIGSVVGKEIYIQVNSPTIRIGDKGNIRRAPRIDTNVPSLMMEENVFCVESVEVGDSIVLTILDDDGVIIYNVTSVASSSSCSITIPDGIMEEGEQLTIIINGESYETNW